jgi:hypothetical protein
MTKAINEYTTDELSAKIEAIRAERERTANALKKYTEELERRKQEIPLGVPLPDKDSAPFVGVYELGFPSEKSFFTFSKRFQNYVTATRDNTRGEPIDIQALLPLLKKGKVCYSPELGWAWCSNDGKITCGKDQWYSTGENWLLNAFNLKPAEDWEDSLMECGL